MGNAFRKAVCSSVAATMALAGCGTPRTIDAIPVPSAQYAHLDCEQLNAEAQRVLARYVELGGKIDDYIKAAQALEPLATVSIIISPLTLLWLPFLPGMYWELEEQRQREFEYGRLMGERTAILQAAAEKGCPEVAQQPKTGAEPKTIPDATK